VQQHHHGCVIRPIQPVIQRHAVAMWAGAAVRRQE
jgi:hypothetical protein